MKNAIRIVKVVAFALPLVAVTTLYGFAIGVALVCYGITGNKEKAESLASSLPDSF